MPRMPRLARRILAGSLLAVACWLPTVGSSGAATFDVDRAHLSIHFAVSHYGISHVRGRFAKIDAKVEFDQDAKSGVATATVDAGSIDTGNALLDGVLRSAQYLDTGTYPEVRFVSERFVFDGAALTAVDGRLWLHGVQRPVRLTTVRFTCRDVAAGIARRHVCGGTFRAVFKRSDFAMTGFLPDVGDEVELLVEVEATRQ